MGKKPQKPDSEEIALFRSEVADATVLKQDKLEPYRPKPKPRPLPANREEQEDGFDTDPEHIYLETGEELLYQQPGVQNRLFRDLRSGRLPPQAMLDLHGMRVAEAADFLLDFLSYAKRHQLRVVHIIHGKGFGSEGRQPILKQKINQWLRQREEVLAFCSAPRFDGGTGAVYVLLSKKQGSGR